MIFRKIAVASMLAAAGTLAFGGVAQAASRYPNHQGPGRDRHGPPPAPHPSGYTYRTISAGKYTLINGINSSGTFVGSASGQNGVPTTEFVSGWRGRLQFYTLPSSWSVSTTTPGFPTPAGITDSGVIVGDYADSAGVLHAYVKYGNHYVELSDPAAGTTSGLGTEAENISADGSAIVGIYFDSSGAQHGFVYRNGTWTTFDVPGSISSGVNFYKDGEIGGVYQDSSGTLHGFTAQFGRSGSVTTVDYPGQPTGSDNGTNLSSTDRYGTLFGTVYNTSGGLFGFADQAGRFTTIAVPGAYTAGTDDGTAILNASLRGVVVGGYSTAAAPGSTYGDYDAGFIAIPK